MNSPKLLAKKLSELIKLASQANTGFEKAAVYSAARAIKSEFNADEEEFDGYTLEKVTKACWHICAAVGYDVSNSHDSSQHISWALGEVNTLQSVLEKSS